MNGLNFEAINKARLLLNDNNLSSTYHENDNTSDGLLNNLLSNNVNLFWSAMHQCFDLTDIIHYQFTHLNQTLPVIIGNPDEEVNNSGVQLQSLYNWCNLGKTTWFINIFTIMHNNSWQANFSLSLQHYLLPILLLINCFSLITSISGVYQLYSLSSKSNQKVMILMQHQSIVQCYLPATWPLILSYCIFGLLWLILVLGLNMITNQLTNNSISLHSHDFYCRTVTYMTNILRYIPTWLIGLMLCDRAIGEYRNRYYVYNERRGGSRHRVVDRRRPDVECYSHVGDDDDPEENDHGKEEKRKKRKKKIECRLTLPKVIYNETSDTLSYISNSQSQLDGEINCLSSHNKIKKLQSTKTSRFLLCRNLCCSRCCCPNEDYIRCVFHGLKRTSYDVAGKYVNDSVLQHNSTSKNNQTSVFSSQTHSYEQLLKDVCSWEECGLGRVGGLVLFSILTALICLINTHLLWLYKSAKSSKRCTLSAGDAVILSIFYPYLLKICHSILPHMLIFISYILLGFTALRKRHYIKTTTMNTHQTRALRRSSTQPSREVDQTVKPQGRVRSKSTHSLFTEPTQLVIYLGIINFLFEFAEVIEWFYTEFIMDNIFQPITNHFNSNMIGFMDNMESSDNDRIISNNNSSSSSSSINSNSSYHMNVYMNDTLLLKNALHSSKGLTESMQRMCSYHLTTGLLRIWASQRFLLTLPILFANSAKFQHVIRYFFRYYFQTLKIQHLFKISFKAQNLTLQNPPSVKPLISSESNRDNSSSNKDVSKVNDTVNTGREGDNDNQETCEHDSGIEIRRIPRLYCCSCITQPLIVNDVDGR